MDDMLLEHLFAQTIPQPGPAVFRGIVKRKQIQQYWQDKKDFFYMDTGYFGNFISSGNPSGKKLFHRIVKNDLQKHWLEKWPNYRWKHLCKMDSRLHWRGWKTKGKKILLIVPNRKSCIFYGYDLEPYSLTDGKRPWLENTIAMIKKHTDMPIVIREKGSRSDRHNYSIFDALDEGIFATVAFNSIAALESVVYGVPAFVTVPCAATPLASQDLSMIEHPFYPDEKLVQQHCNSLAYGQFTEEEIANGTAWRLLNNETCG